MSAYTTRDTCPRCARAKAAWAAVCWRCHVEERERAAELRGYRRGYDAGLRAARCAAPALDPARIRQLLQLCHPDRHAGSPAATDATQWLLAQRRAQGGSP